MKTHVLCLILVCAVALFGCNLLGPADDGNGSPDDDSTPVNNTPSVLLSAARDSIDTGDTETFTATATDADGDTLTYTWYVEGAQVPGATGTSYVFIIAVVGTYEVTVRVSDGTASRSVSLTITVADPPSPYSIALVSELDSTDHTNLANLRCVDVSGSLIAVGTNNGGIVFSEDSGSTWTDLTIASGDLHADSANQVHTIQIDGTKIYAALFKGLHIYDTATSTPVNEITTTYVNDVVVSGGVIYAATDDGLMVSPTGTLSWTTYDKAIDDGANNEWTLSNLLDSVATDGTYIYLGAGHEVIRCDLAISPASFKVFDTSDVSSSYVVSEMWTDGTTLIVSTNWDVRYSSDFGVTWASPTENVGPGPVVGIAGWGTRQVVANATTFSEHVAITSDSAVSWDLLYLPLLSLSDYPEGMAVSGDTIYVALSDGLFIGTLGVN